MVWQWQLAAWSAFLHPAVFAFFSSFRKRNRTLLRIFSLAPLPFCFVRRLHVALRLAQFALQPLALETQPNAPFAFACDQRLLPLIVAWCGNGN
jgi:hypothetical protein